MNEHNARRLAAFERDVAELKVKTASGSLERWSGVLGVLMMAFGIAVAIGAAFESGGKQDARDLDELIILNLAMLAIVLAGAVLFLRRSLQQFWRYWMLRQTFEHQRHLESVVEALRPGRDADAAPADTDDTTDRLNTYDADRFDEGPASA